MMHKCHTCYFKVALCLLQLSLFASIKMHAQKLPEQIPAHVQQTLTGVRPVAIRAHMRFLADDALQGRKPGTNGFALAATYLQTQFEALGLLPAGENNTYLQAVPLRKGQVQENGSSFSMVHKGREQAFTYEQDFILSPHFEQQTSEVMAPVVFVGFGITAPDLKYDDYKKIDVRGKIVAYFNGAPAGFPSNQRAYYSTTKLENAVVHGAVGVISVNLSGDVRTSWEAMVIRARQGGFKWIDKTGKASRAFQELKGVVSLSDTGIRALFATSSKSLEEAMTTAAASVPQSFPLNCTVKIRTQTQFTEVAGQNIAAVLPGSDPSLQQEYVVHTAHLDHFGIGTALQGDSIFNGAHDNASGVAILLETARLYTSLPQAPRRSVLFVGVTAEEWGLLGSDYFASNPTVAADKLVANLNLDMPFFFHPLLDIVPYGSEHSSLSNEVTMAAKYLGIRISKDPIPEQVVFIRSDHFSFIRQGIPALFIKSGFETGSTADGKKINLEWRSKIYHTPKDDMNQPFDFNAAAKHAQLNFLTGYLIANAQRRPVWNAGDFFGNKFGKATSMK